jgi:hypothetical protein
MVVTTSDPDPCPLRPGFGAVLHAIEIRKTRITLTDRMIRRSLRII